MELAMGALCCLLPKLYDLLKEEYNLQKGVKKNIKFLSKELESMHAALCKVAQVPRDQLDEQVNLWARDVRELSYDIENTVDIFMVRVQGRRESAHPNVFKKFGKMAINLFNKGFRIADTMHEIKAQVQDVADRRDRYKIDSIAAANIVATSIDPRLSALYRNNRELIGVQEARDELIQMLTAEGINVSKQQQLKTISIVGFGGLGKTTLAKAVYDRLQTHFDCRAFVAAGRNPDLKKVFRDILIDIDKQKYMDVNVTVLDERQLINKLRELLQNKRYLIVIDDIWDTSAWAMIMNALVDSDCGSRV